MVPARFIRDWINAAYVSTNCNWVEIQALTAAGINVAQGCAVTASATGTANPGAITDGSTAVTPRFDILSPGIPSWVMVDLGFVRLDISRVTVWHYWADGRTYKQPVTEVSSDGVNWVKIYDYRTSGEYAESATGRTSYLPAGALVFFNPTSGTYFAPGRNPVRPQISPTPVQQTARTSGGVPYGYDPTLTELLIPLSWSSMGYADMGALVEFFKNVAVGMANDFSVADPWDGTIYTARFATPILEITESAPGRYSVSLQLRRVP